MTLKTAAKTASKTSAKKECTKIVPKRKPALAEKIAISTKIVPGLLVTTKHPAAAVAEQCEMPLKQSSLMLTSAVDLMISHLKKGDRLKINGLGTLAVKHRPARKGRNPAAGAAIQINASKKIAFRPAKELKEAFYL